ncbi:MAG: phosphotransferase, partial [Acidobacteriota bacterium]|nr:phosphotransferase [Acidobacteriota bacterium]
MRRVGPLIASGRDADVYEYGEHLVLRRARTGRSMALEARVMEHVRSEGYPVPRIEDVSADGSELVMERVVGPSMLEDITRRPWTLRRHGASLARLHVELHELGAPAWLSPFATAPGERIGHYDLHPVNVLMSPTKDLISVENAA